MKEYKESSSYRLDPLRIDITFSPIGKQHVFYL